MRVARPTVVGRPESLGPRAAQRFAHSRRLRASGRFFRGPSPVEVVVDSGSNTVIGVVVGALLVVIVAVWALGGFERSEPEVVIDLPNVEVNPAGPLAPG